MTFVIFSTGNQSPIVLYEILTQNGIPSKVIYYLSDSQENREALLSFIKDEKFVGFSFASQSTGVAFALASHLRPKTKANFIFGGVHPTIDPLSCLDYCDAVCIGEGERAILDIATGDYLKSNNLVYKRNGKVIRNPMHPLFAGFDSIPLRRPFTDDHYSVGNGCVVRVDAKKFYEILPSREVDYMQIFSEGCPHSCSYCCNSKFHELYPGWGKVRSRSAKRIVEEICMNIKLNPKIIRVCIQDDCFLGNSTEWLKEFVTLYKERVNKPVVFLSIPSHVTEEKMKIMKQIDICYIDLGLQTGSQRMNKLYRRHFSKETFLKACHLIRDAGISLSLDVLFDNPWETDEDYAQTLDVLTQVRKPFLIQQYSLKLYPGTKLYEDCKERPLPNHNKDFSDYALLGDTAVNQLIILTQILPRKTIFFLFKHKSKLRIFIKLIYVPICMFVLSFTAIGVVSPRGFRQRIAFIISYRKWGILMLKDILGIKK